MTAPRMFVHPPDDEERTVPPDHFPRDVRWPA